MLNAAYDDAAGVTAQFNLNVLTRINRELGGDIDVSSFRHFAKYNRELARIEMHLESRQAQTVNVLGRNVRVHSRERQSIPSRVTSSRYGLSQRWRRNAGWTVPDVFSDERDYFSVYVLRQN